jgi:hypothetical protein
MKRVGVPRCIAGVTHAAGIGLRLAAALRLAHGNNAAEEVRLALDLS